MQEGAHQRSFLLKASVWLASGRYGKLIVCPEDGTLLSMDDRIDPMGQPGMCDRAYANYVSGAV